MKLRAHFADCGLLIAECGLRIRNPKSEIRNRRISRRLVLIWTLAALLTFIAGSSNAFAQRPRLRDAFNLVAGQSENEEFGPGVQQPFSDDDGASAQPVEALPPPQVFQGRLPLAGSQVGDGVELSQTRDGRITLKVRDVSLSKILAILAQAQGLNIVASNDIDAMISITLNDVPVEEALTAILSVANYTWVERNGIILITSLADSANLPAAVQGRQIQVFELDFASARVVAEAVTGFLSPIGKVSVSESDPSDNRLTRELVVVEDLPESLARIAEYICQVDRPPRQVLIEAHVLQINLDDTNRQGVNIDGIVRLCDVDLTLKTTGFANEAAPQAFLATLEGGDLGHVIELLQTTTDSKTLGAPKLLVLNEQEARLQVGEQLGFKVTTTTETSTLESVQFLDVGVVLSIIPRITRDGRVLLSVKPEVSSGQVNPETGLPEEETTELETDIMLNDGQGMIIGGLIKETDSVTQSKIPWLGDVKGLGWFFRNSEVTKDRVEIIVALVPRIQPYNPEWQAYEQGELVRAGVPLLHGPLQRTYRPWDPVLPDGNRVYRRLLPHPNEVKRNWKHGHGAPRYNPWTSQYTVPAYPLPQQQFYDNGCDPTVMPQESLPHEAMPPQEGFLSDELEPMMRIRPGSGNGVEIITDQ
jgi:type IV pilus assembly protein PilQ